MKLEAHGLCFGYSGRRVLNNISFSVESGDCVAILGTNGVGKSTLLKCLNRILRCQEGRVCIGGTDIGRLDGNELARRIGYVAQASRFADTTVFDAVLLGRKPYIKWDVTRRDLELARDVLERLSLSEYAMRGVNELSGGEMQKVAIARALAQQPDVLLFDEPTSNLDLKNQLEVIGIIQEIVRESGMAAIVTMHDLNLALRFAGKFIMLRNGEIYAAGGPEILTAASIRDVYGVDVAIEAYGGSKVVIPR
jgi:iron complex transport system ATP-binding protein